MSTNLKGKVIGKDEMSKLKTVIETLEKDPRSVDFLHPVDYVGKFIYFKFIFHKFFIFKFNYKNNIKLII
jgi:hypothetical protein